MTCLQKLRQVSLDAEFCDMHSSTPLISKHFHHVDHLSDSRLAIDYHENVAQAVHAEQLTGRDMKIIASAAAWLHIIDLVTNMSAVTVSQRTNNVFI